MARARAPGNSVPLCRPGQSTERTLLVRRFKYETFLGVFGGSLEDDFILRGCFDDPLFDRL